MLEEDKECSGINRNEVMAMVADRQEWRRINMKIWRSKNWETMHCEWPFGVPRMHLESEVEKRLCVDNSVPIVLSWTLLLASTVYRQVYCVIFLIQFNLSLPCWRILWACPQTGVGRGTLYLQTLPNHCNSFFTVLKNSPVVSTGLLTGTISNRISDTYSEPN